MKSKRKRVIGLANFIEQHMNSHPHSTGFIPASSRRLYQWLRLMVDDEELKPITYEVTELVIDYLETVQGYTRYWVGSDGLYFVKRGVKTDEKRER